MAKIKNLHIENFKSIDKMDLPLGALNILIGENGCGKTNILEAAAIGVAASQNKLDNEYLAVRGIRKTANRFMKSAFAEEKAKEPIIINFSFDENRTINFRINENAKGQLEERNQHAVSIDDILFNRLSKEELDAYNSRQALFHKIMDSNFLLYAPENTFLRKFEEEGGIDGLGFRGEGLFDSLQKLKYLASLYDYEAYQIELEKLELELEFLKKELNAIKQEYKQGKVDFEEMLGTDFYFDTAMSDNYTSRMELQAQKAAFEQLPKIKTYLRELLDWFEDFQITGSNMERKLYIKDRFLPEATLFDQRSANEGFLLLLFYLTLFTGAETPNFFAIDNIDTGLNPKLGSRLIEILAKLAKEHGKQAIITTHNPAILDGLDLKDEEQRLFVVKRNPAGKTAINRILPNAEDEEDPVPLSEQFLRGYIGGLPLNF